MLGQSKTAHQAEIDAACELIDFWRFNVSYMTRIYEEQPISSPGVWNRMEYRPLEGFVFAVTPFNFTAIGGNLPTAPALMGNTVVWKPASTAAYSAHFLMQLLQEAGLPDGVINLVYGPGARDRRRRAREPGPRRHPLHRLDRRLPDDVEDDRRRTSPRYRNYPRIVGETGGKDFIFAHPSPPTSTRVATAIVRGAFEYQGQKCSAASRVFVADNLWPELRERLVEEIDALQMGDVARLRELHGRRHRRATRSSTQKDGDRGGESRRRRGCARRRRVVRRREGWFVAPDGDRDRRSRTSA